MLLNWYLKELAQQPLTIGFSFPLGDPLRDLQCQSEGGCQRCGGYLRRRARLLDGAPGPAALQKAGLPAETFALQVYILIWVLLLCRR